MVWCPKNRCANIHKNSCVVPLVEGEEKTYVKKGSLAKWCCQRCAWTKKSLKLVKWEDKDA